MVEEKNYKAMSFNEFRDELEQESERLIKLFEARDNPIQCTQDMIFFLVNNLNEDNITKYGLLFDILLSCRETFDGVDKENTENSGEVDEE